MHNATVYVDHPVHGEDTCCVLEIECIDPGSDGNTSGPADSWEPPEGPEFEVGRLYIDPVEHPEWGNEDVDHSLISKDWMDGAEKEALEAGGGY